MVDTMTRALFNPLRLQDPSVAAPELALPVVQSMLTYKTGFELIETPGQAFDQVAFDRGQQNFDQIQAQGEPYRILALGPTGTGKTTLAAKLGFEVVQTHSTQSDTEVITLYTDGAIPRIEYIDTPGFGDNRVGQTRGEKYTDRKHKTEILKFLQGLAGGGGEGMDDRDKATINLVVLTVADGGRSSTQALSELKFAIDILQKINAHRLVILVRGDVGYAAHVEAYKKVVGTTVEPEVKCVLPDWYAAELGPHTILFKEGDAVGNFKRLLGSVKDLTPMEMVDHDGVCLDCGAKGDPRCFDPCHRRVESAHGHLIQVQRHTLPPKSVHGSTYQVYRGRDPHAGTILKVLAPIPFVGPILAGAGVLTDSLRSKTTVCQDCDRSTKEEGCRWEAECCGQRTGPPGAGDINGCKTFTMCQDCKEDVTATGCKVVCRVCGMDNSQGKWFERGCAEHGEEYHRLA